MLHPGERTLSPGEQGDSAERNTKLGASLWMRLFTSKITVVTSTAAHQISQDHDQTAWNIQCHIRRINLENIQGHRIMQLQVLRPRGNTLHTAGRHLRKPRALAHHLSSETRSLQGGGSPQFGARLRRSGRWPPCHEPPLWSRTWMMWSSLRRRQSWWRLWPRNQWGTGEDEVMETLDKSQVCSQDKSRSGTVWPWESLNLGHDWIWQASIRNNGSWQNGGDQPRGQSRGKVSQSSSGHWEWWRKGDWLQKGHLNVSRICQPDIYTDISSGRSPRRRTRGWGWSSTRSSSTSGWPRGSWPGSGRRSSARCEMTICDWSEWNLSCLLIGLLARYNS